MNREALESLDKETLVRLVLAQAESIAALTRQVEVLTARVAELEAKPGLPPKTPNNSSTPPSRGQQPSENPASQSPRKAHRGAHRRLHPNPTSRRDVMASSCQHCGADVSQSPQGAREAYRLSARARPSTSLMPRAPRSRCRQTSSANAAWRERCCNRTRLAGASASGCFDRLMRWLWVFHHADSAVFAVEPSRGKRVAAVFLGDFRPDIWVSGRFGAPMGWASENQVCLAHLIRDVQYCIEAGDKVLVPDIRHLPARAGSIGRQRERLAEATLKACEAKLDQRLDAIMARAPSHAAGVKLQRMIKKIRRRLFVFVTLSTAGTNCARWRRKSVSVGLREKGRKALACFFSRAH